METEASVAASSATTLGHPDTQTVWRSGWQVWMLHLPPSSPVAERTLASVEKAEQIYGKINITEDLAQQLWHTDTHKETKTYYSHCRDTEIHKTCATGARRRFVSGGGQWNGTCRPPDTKEDHLPTIVGPESHLHPHLKVDILRQWPKPHLTHKITSTWTSFATEQPEWHLTIKLLRVTAQLLFFCINLNISFLMIEIFIFQCNQYLNWCWRKGRGAPSFGKCTLKIGLSFAFKMWWTELLVSEICYRILADIKKSQTGLVWCCWRWDWKSKLVHSGKEEGANTEPICPWPSRCSLAAD